MTNQYLIYQQNIETNRSNVAKERETKRHNVVSENETQRHNMAFEAETKRHNIATEQLGNSNLSESIRHNRYMEGLSWQQHQEAVRHNIAAEYNATVANSAASQQAYAQLLNAKTNQANARINRAQLDINQQDADTRARQATNAWLNYTDSSMKTAETHRYNVVQEDQQDQRISLEQDKVRAEAFKDYTQGARNITNTVGDVWSILRTGKLRSTGK